MSAKPFALAMTGISVIKAAQNLPQSATATLYTVSGGSVFVTGLLGLVSTSTGGVATNLSVGITGNNTAIVPAIAVASKTAPTWLVPQESAGSAATALLLSAPVFLSNAFQPFGSFVPFICGPTIINWTTNANDTGQMQWYLWYTPIDSGASVS